MRGLGVHEVEICELFGVGGEERGWDVRGGHAGQICEMRHCPFCGDITDEWYKVTVDAKRLERREQQVGKKGECVRGGIVEWGRYSPKFKVGKTRCAGKEMGEGRKRPSIHGEIEVQGREASGE